MDRRRFLLAATGGLALGALGATMGFPAASPPDDLDVLDLDLEGDPRLARRARVLVPRGIARGARLPVLVLLHGLAETASADLGIRAWHERYGLADAYRRLLRPPVTSGLERRRYLSDARASAIDRELASRPFRPLVLACPYTPNPHRLEGVRTLDAYATWIVDTLLPAVREKTPAASDPGGAGLDGCSLGGYVALEVFARKPESFGTFGTVQAAISTGSAERYATALAKAMSRAGHRPLHIETSSEDPYRAANQELAHRLADLGVAADLAVVPGPHEQPWLREVGTLEMLLWHERRLARPEP